MDFGVYPCITFPGCAEEVVNYYVSIFPDSKIETVTYFQKSERDIEGKIKHVHFSIMGNSFIAFDMDSLECPVMNWSISFYIHCNDEAMFDSIFEKLAVDGEVLMGPEALGNLRKASWITDKFGVTWQVIWE